MDELEKDKIIKRELQKDDLISKKADDVFNNFLAGKLNMEEKSEIAKENKVKKMNNWVRNLSIAASIVVVLGGANVYAHYKGYDNVFFAIRHFITGDKKEVVEKEDLLYNQDITISYKNINIMDGLSIQVNNFTRQGNKGTLYLKINEESNLTYKPYYYIVSDLDNNEKELVRHITTRPKDIGTSSTYGETIEIPNLKENTNNLRLTITEEGRDILVTIDIDLVNRELDIIESGIVAKQMSEKELKEVLNYYALLNLYNDTEAKYYDHDLLKVQIATELIEWSNKIAREKAGDDNITPNYSIENITTAVKEFCGENLQSKIEKYDKQAYMNFERKALVINIDELKYENGQYIVTFTYCQPTVDEWRNGLPDSLPIFKTTMKFKLNVNHKFTRYCLLNADNVTSEKIQDTNVNANVNTNTSTNINSTNVSTSTNNNETTSSNTNINNNETNANNATNINTNNDSDLDVEQNTINVENQSENNSISTIDWVTRYAMGIQYKCPASWTYDNTTIEDEIGTRTSMANGTVAGSDGIHKKLLVDNLTVKTYEPMAYKGYKENELDAVISKLTNDLGLTEYPEASSNTNQLWKKFIKDGKINTKYYINIFTYYQDVEKTKLAYVVNIVEIQGENTNNIQAREIAEQIVNSLYAGK